MAYGDLGAIVDTLQHWPARAHINKLQYIANEIFAISFRQAYASNYAVTISIDSLGEISDAIVDQLNYVASAAEDRNRFAKLLSTLYVAVTVDTSHYSMFDTFQIFGDGAIGDAVLDHHVFGPSLLVPHAVEPITSSCLAVVNTEYNGAFGRIATVEISGAGIIDHTLLDSVEIESVACVEPGASMVHPGIMAVVYRGPSYYGILKTYSISVGGTISAAAIDTLTFESAAITLPRIICVHENFCAIAYRDALNYGKLAIVEISEAGGITDTVIDTYIFDSTAISRPFPYAIGQGYIGVAYANSSNQLTLKTFKVDAAGSLNATTIDTLVYPPLGVGDPDVIHVQGDVWAASMQGPGETGTTVTFGLETPHPSSGGKNFMRGMYR